MTTFDEIREGLNIFAKYSEPSIEADHEIIYAGAGDEGEISESDESRLEEMGWIFDRGLNSWTHGT